MNGGSFGGWLLAAIVVVGGVGVLEAFDARLAMLFAVLLLLALFLRYPRAWTEIRAMLGGG